MTSTTRNIYNSNSGNEDGEFRVHPGVAAAVIAGSAAAVYAISRSRSNGSSLAGQHHFIRTQTIDRPASELWKFWRDEQNAPRFMQHIQSVRKTGENTSHWTMQAPGGTRIEWDSEIYDERPGELLAWRTTQGEWQQQGRLLLRPAPDNRGAEVRLEMSYDIPGGAVARSLAAVMGREPEQVGRANLARFKQLMESGEIITVLGQPYGKRGAKGKLLRVLMREPVPGEQKKSTGRKANAENNSARKAVSSAGERWRQAIAGSQTSSWKKARAAR